MPAGGGVYGTRFYGFRGGPAWHRIGTVYDTDQRLTAVEAYERGDVEVPMRHFRLLAVDEATGEPIMDPASDPENPVPLYAPVKGIWRWQTPEDPEVQFFNTASEDFPNISNRSVCEALDASGITRVFPVETMGVLDQGRAFFVTLDAGEWDIKGDPMKTYVFAREGKDAQRSFQLGLTPVRIVCMNTERLALEQANINLRLPHNSFLQSNITLWAGIIGQLREAHERMKAMRTRLAEFQASQLQAKEVFEVAWPLPTEPNQVKLARQLQDAKLTEEQAAKLTKVEEDYLYRCGQIEKRREAAVELLGLRNEEIQPRELAGTFHIVFNVVTELENYRRGHDKGGKTEDSILLGERMQAMTRGFKRCQELIGV